MGKLGLYSYPDIRFGDAVQISGRILSKFKGVVGVQGLAWELGMAKSSGALFAKVAAMRDFGLVDGRGELKVTELAQRILNPVSKEEEKKARSDAFMKVELLFLLFSRFDGDIPDDSSFFIALEEITRAPRIEIVKRAGLLQKHLVDLIRSMNRERPHLRTTEVSVTTGRTNPASHRTSVGQSPDSGQASELSLTAGQIRLSLPLTTEFIDLTITALRTLRDEMSGSVSGGAGNPSG
jgi:hypothetical protein